MERILFIASGAAIMLTAIIFAFFGAFRYCDEKEDRQERILFVTLGLIGLTILIIFITYTTVI